MKLHMKEGNKACRALNIFINKLSLKTGSTVDYVLITTVTELR